tara:strand:- start:4150 stop:4440 length:291 start_codon:yes stop_codon:yes gene_type:complete
MTSLKDVNLFPSLTGFLWLFQISCNYPCFLSEIKRLFLIEASAKGLNEVVLDEIKVKRGRGNGGVPSVRASRESRVFAFLSPKEPFAEASLYKEGK